jgi:16S rRNA processing protein RimM
MGQVLAPFGVRGWIKVQPFTETTGALLGYPSWWLQTGDGWSEHRLEQGAVHGKLVVAKLAGTEDREAAAAFRRREVAVPRSAMPESAPGEFYWTDLVGLAVVSREGVELGRVESLLDNGAQSVMVVRGRVERLIPFVEEFVDEVSLAEGRVKVDWAPDWDDGD